MRAALLPTPGNVETLAYWLRNFATWSNYVDELLVLVNGSTDERLARMVGEAGGRCVMTPERLGHDGALLALLNGTSAEYVVLCEDDAYVRHPEAVWAAFTSVERRHVDIVGSPRHEDYAASPLQEWGPYQRGDLAELRHGLWPTFLFIRRAALMETDREFGDQRWWLGEGIVGWGNVTKEACEFVGVDPDYIHLDTLFGTTFQLRNRGLFTRLVHHVRLFDALAVEQWIAEDPPWFHVTGLSTLDQLDGPLATLPDYGPGGGLWTRRLAWWGRMGIDTTPYLARMDIDLDELARWDARFAPWVTWDV
jgi:glycosyltransferase involved in cell wall biosynthesis